MTSQSQESQTSFTILWPHTSPVPTTKGPQAVFVSFDPGTANLAAIVGLATVTGEGVELGEIDGDVVNVCSEC